MEYINPGECFSFMGIQPTLEKLGGLTWKGTPLISKFSKLHTTFETPNRAMSALNFWCDRFQKWMQTVTYVKSFCNYSSTKICKFSTNPCSKGTCRDMCLIVWHPWVILPWVTSFHKPHRQWGLTIQEAPWRSP